MRVFLTADSPGIGGCIKQRPEDFLVDEQPLYPPSGEGEHLMLLIEKTRLTTHEAVRLVRRAFGCGRGDIGYAGLKDKHAITRQHLTVRLPRAGGEEDAIARLNDTRGIQVLWADRHGNKIRRGHHAGNRFAIRIRDVSPTDVIRAKPVVDRLVEHGLPNGFGPQRFGFRGNGHLLGLHLLRNQPGAFLDELLGADGHGDDPELVEARRLYREGDYAGALERWPRPLRFDRQALDALRRGRDAASAVRGVDPAQRVFFITAMQSWVFNRVLARRLDEGTFERLMPGDLAWKHDSRSVFAVDADTAAMENAEGGRVGRFEVSPSGPMWGPRMTRAGGDVDGWEVAALAELDLTPEDLEGSRAEGARRPLRVRVRDAEVSGGVDEHGPYVRLTFELPRGSFATTLLAEVMKSGDVGDDDDATDEE